MLISSRNPYRQQHPEWCLAKSQTGWLWPTHVDHDINHHEFTPCQLAPIGMSLNHTSSPHKDSTHSWFRLVWSAIQCTTKNTLKPLLRSGGKVLEWYSFLLTLGAFSTWMRNWKNFTMIQSQYISYHTERGKDRKDRKILVLYTRSWQNREQVQPTQPYSVAAHVVRLGACSCLLPHVLHSFCLQQAPQLVVLPYLVDWPKLPFPKPWMASVSRWL